MAVTRLRELGLPPVEADSDPRRWLQLGVLALALAGLFAILLVLSRMPVIGAWFPWLDFFRTALVVHVDQSVLIWFLAMLAVVMSLGMPSTGYSRTAWGLSLAGCLGIALAAFVGEGEALMNNYIPVLQRPLFHLSVAAFVCGVLMLLPLALPRARGLLGSVQQALSVALVVSLLSVLWSLWQLAETDFGGHIYYEYLYWGGGHALQFVYTTLLLFAWLVLALASGLSMPGRVAHYRGLLWLGVAPLLAVPVLYALYHSTDLQLRTGFTELMRWGGALAIVPMGALCVLALRRRPHGISHVQRPLRRTLWMSWWLFFAGGLIALFIQGVNTIIPAHYHGSVVSITMALMGLAYALMPRFGYAPIRGRLADWQPLIYGGGQLLHVGGLAVSGALGMQRKTAGDAQMMEGFAVHLTMGIMGLGGLMAVVGGGLFVWIMYKGFQQRVEP